MQLIFLFSVDTSLGRIENASLSQQTLMEVLISKIDNTEMILRDTGEIDDIFTWKNVAFTTDKEVEEIDWSYWWLTGTFDIQWLPPTLRILSVWRNHLKGEIDFTNLPASMTHLDLSENEFFGSVDLRSLPSGMIEFDVGKNSFSGSISLQSLPVGIQKLYLHNNSLEGETGFGSLPESLVDLDLSYTNLSGDLLFDGWKYFVVHNSHINRIDCS
mmetsp:Transcript_5079/g.7589  ORF Transcript_5079/g.7589 Transcript_5079/m.7589 type:complete len:215 (-) Transcript_5079:22-666(-)